MATEQRPEGTLPPFQPFATTNGFISDAEIDRLIADHESLLEEGKLGFGNTDSAVRRSKVVMFGTEERYHWLYERVWAAASDGNRQMFGVDIATVEPNIQLARYDSGDRGFYDWHTDFASVRQLRKLSISVQLSRSEDYEGGDLELIYGTRPTPMDRTRGALIAFPSFMLHRVTPVTRGTRWSLVAWIVGPRWR
jgi:PKHD-type hydroxylase